MREDYSHDGDAWSRKSQLPHLLPQLLLDRPLTISGADFPHEHARSRAFRWGEDGIAGVSDTHGLQNIGFSFWNEEEYEMVLNVVCSRADEPQ